MTAEYGAPWAVILGASCGTGAAIARAVARDPGFDIFGAHRGHHPEKAEALATFVRGLQRNIHLRQADAGTAESAARGTDELLRVAGPRSVKLFVHSIANASIGGLTREEGHRLTPCQIQKTLESMASSFVYWAQELVSKDLLAPRAHLLGLSNPMPDVIARDTAAIGAAKAALEVYVRHLARELGPRGHRVNLLKFGAIVTPAMARTLGGRLPALERALHDAIPAQRLCTLDEVGRFVAVLAGEDAAWFNGATIDFTGGESQGLFDALIRASTERSMEIPHEPSRRASDSLPTSAVAIASPLR